jgi:hypothetical protein
MQRFAYPALLILLIISFFWKLSFTNQYEWMWGPDLALQVLPWYEEEARQFQDASFPLWDPHAWGGQPLLAQGQPGAAYPLNWLLFLTPRVHGHISPVALKWFCLAIYCMAALFSYLLCRDLQLSQFAALIGGLVFALSSYIGTVVWPQMLNGAVWAPLIFLFLLRAVRGDRPFASASLCGLVWGMSWLSGHHQAPIFISLATGFTWIWFVLSRRSWTVAACALTATVFMFLTAAVQLLPAREYSHLAKRWVSGPDAVGGNEVVPYSVHTMFSLSPLHALGIVVPNISGYTDAFIGVIAFALAAIAVTASWNLPHVKLFTALAIGGFAYALGFHNVFQGILYAVIPFLDMARAPAMALIVFSLGVSVLAAHGADQLATLRDSLVLRRTAWILLGFGLLVWTAIFCILLNGNLSWATDDRSSMTALIAVSGGALLFAWHKGNVSPRSAAVLLTGLLLIELSNVSSYYLMPVDDAGKMADLSHMRGDTDIAQFLDRQPRPFRVDIENDDLPVSWPTYNNFDEIKASGASITVNRIQTEFWTPQTRSIMGVQFTVGRFTSMPDAKEVFRGTSGLKVFQNPHAFPRAWTVHELIRVSTVAQGSALIASHMNELHSKALMVSEGAGKVTGRQHSLSVCTSPDSVAITVNQPKRVSIHATMACDGMLVLSDTFYPGWHATIDNRPAPVYEVNLAMRGVLVPVGTHEVEYRYAPRSAYLGAGMSAIGILGSFAGALLFRRRSA